MASIFRKKGEVNGSKPFFFFESFVNIFFVIILGIFANLILLFLPLSLIHSYAIYPQVCIFSLIGLIFFLFSRWMFMDKYKHQLRHLNYSAFLVSRNKLLFGILGTINFYLLFCGIFLIFLGVTKGFGFKYSDSSHVLLYADNDKTKLIGLIILLVHVFLLCLVRIIVYYWARILSYAHREFEKRRKNLEIVRNKANLES